jgi:hypothetical protein
MVVKYFVTAHEYTLAHSGCPNGDSAFPGIGACVKGELLLTYKRRMRTSGSFILLTDAPDYLFLCEKYPESA